MANIALAQLMFDRTAMVTGLDDAICTMHFQSSGTWTHTTRVNTTADLKTWFTNASSNMDSSHVFREVRWYDVPATAPYHPVFNEVLPISPPPGLAGTGTGTVMPPQVAMTCTLKTASRKHWGRFYVPTNASVNMDTTNKGVFKNASCDGLALATQILSQARSGTDHGALVVWSARLGTFQDITLIQVDNVPDIQRRRRVKRATYKKQLSP